MKQMASIRIKQSMYTKLKEVKKKITDILGILNLNA